MEHSRQLHTDKIFKETRLTGVRAVKKIVLTAGIWLILGGKNKTGHDTSEGLLKQLGVH